MSPNDYIGTNPWDIANVSPARLLRGNTTHLEYWLCSGQRKDGRPCKAVLMEIDPTIPCPIAKKCDRCGTMNRRYC